MSSKLCMPCLLFDKQVHSPYIQGCWSADYLAGRCSGQGTHPAQVGLGGEGVEEGARVRQPVGAKDGGVRHKAISPGRYEGALAGALHESYLSIPCSLHHDSHLITPLLADAVHSIWM